MRIVQQSLPETGSIVKVRRQRYVVTNIRPSALPTLTLQPLSHLVELSSIEDDGFGESLSVIWEIEPGAHNDEQISPSSINGFDEPRRLDAFIDAVRWGATSSADTQTMLAPFRSGIEIEDYQLDPVIRAIQMPRVNLLIADDVGLGKTIEAGLVCQELLLRHRIRTILIVCPASLQVQWHDQMRDKFGLEFRIIDTPLMKDLRRQRGIHVNPWTHFPRLITSIDFLKGERPWRLMQETLQRSNENAYSRRFDMLVIDEAHNIAPSGHGKYAIDSKRTRTIRQLAPHFEHKLFLSATPHNGYPESFTALLELLDNQRFARGITPRPEQLQAVMVRRLKSELLKWDDSPRFPQRILEPIIVNYSDSERQMHLWLREYTKSRLIQATSPLERLATEFVLLLLKKRLFSSPAAFLHTLLRHRQSLKVATTHRRDRIQDVRILRQQIDQYESEEDYREEDKFTELTEDAIDEATHIFRVPSSLEEELLRKMQSWADHACMRPDSKTQQLIAWLEQEIRPNEQWSDQRVIIFTEYRDTQKWLSQQLSHYGFGRKGRLMQLFGGMDSDDREAIKAAFQAHPAISPVRILLATDAASEGIDLQNYCSRMIHFEIPWNPNRMEQRNGRIDRHGQTASQVNIYHFVGSTYQEQPLSPSTTTQFTLDDDLVFLFHIVRKVNQIRVDLGSTGAVIAQQVEDAMLGRRNTLEIQQVEERGRVTRKSYTFEINLKKRIQEQIGQYHETQREMHLEPENIATVVQIALQLAEQPPLIPALLPPLYGSVTASKPVYHLPQFRGTWSKCAEGLLHPHTKNIRPITFDEEVARKRDDVVYAHLNHRLVQMSLRFLRSELWSSESHQQRIHRVTARMISAKDLREPAVISQARLLILGGDQYRLHEEIIAVGGILREGRFVKIKGSEVTRILAAATTTAAPTQFQSTCIAQFEKHRLLLEDALTTHAENRFETLKKDLKIREQDEIFKTTTILTELQDAIKRELTGPTGIMQLRLDFSPEEQSQLRDNSQFLQARIEEIPEEIQRETSAIQHRFADMHARHFPLAITFLLPDTLL